MRDPYHPYGPPGWSMPPDVMMLIGRIDERTGTTADRVEETVDRLDRIDSRLAAGDKRMDVIDQKITSLEQRGQEVPGWEKALKSSLVWVLVSIGITVLGWSEPVIRLFDSASRVLVALKGLAP